MPFSLGFLCGVECGAKTYPSTSFVIICFNADRNASVFIDVFSQNSPGGSAVHGVASLIAFNAIGILDGMSNVSHDEVSFDKSL